MSAQIERETEWAYWTDEQLREYEEWLYDQEIAGEDTWADRDQVLWEMNRRGLLRPVRRAA